MQGAMCDRLQVMIQIESAVANSLANEKCRYFLLLKAYFNYQLKIYIFNCKLNFSWLGYEQPSKLL